MLTKTKFKKLTLEPELIAHDNKMLVPNVPNQLLILCPKCKSILFKSELENKMKVCWECGHHFRIPARKRLDLILDGTSFKEHDKELSSNNILAFPGYEEKLAKAKKESGEVEGVICGEGTIEGIKCAIFAMEPFFMMGSMGAVIGEKITGLFEFATDEKLPVIGFTASGGARMQEGIISLLQMAKISGAVKRHSNNGNLYITVLTDPTTGGVMASFAMEGDIILSEPEALIGFAGPRVIEQTIRRRLPDGFQTAEFLKKKGFVDDIIERRELKKYLGNLLKLHKMEEK